MTQQSQVLHTPLSHTCGCKVVKVDQNDKESVLAPIVKMYLCLLLYHDFVYYIDWCKKDTLL